MSRIMRKFSRAAVLAFFVPCYLALAACGGGGNALETPKVLKESELYNPVTNPSGVVESPGQIAVLGLQLNTSDLRPSVGAPNNGVEDLWFDVKDAQAILLSLESDTFGPVDRVEIRDAGNTLLTTLSASQPAVLVTLDKGWYQALVYASAAAAAPTPVFVEYGVPASSIQGAQLPLKAQAQGQYTITLPEAGEKYILSPHLYFAVKCTKCDLQEHAFPKWHFANQDYVGTSFKNANLSWADFAKARLKDANFQGANLSGANFTGANLAGAVFTNADLSNAIWVDGVKRCAPGSIGGCR